MIKNILLLTIFFAPFLVVGQNKNAWDGIGIESNIFYGNMMRHTKNITAPVAKDVYAVDLNFVKKYQGKADWEVRRRYPEGGMGVIFMDYRNRDLYGVVFGIFPSLRLRFITTENLDWSARVGMGFAYVTRPYERVPNPNLDNETIGSYIDNISPLLTNIKYRINDHWELQGGAQLIHVSNASFRRPNLGINVWGAHLGLRYFPVTNRPPRLEREVPRLRNRILVYGKASIAFAERNGYSGGINRIYNGGVYATMRYRGINKVILGADYTFNTAVYALMKYTEVHPGEENRYASQTSIYAGNEFMFKNFGIVMQVGVYTTKMYDQSQNLYQKLGGNFYILKEEKGILKELVISGLLKTHFQRAELFEIGLSLGF